MLLAVSWQPSNVQTQTDPHLICYEAVSQMKVMFYGDGNLFTLLVSNLFTLLLASILSQTSRKPFFLPNLKQEILLCSLPINKLNEVLIPNAFLDLSLFNSEFCHQLNMRFDTHNLEI